MNICLIKDDNTDNIMHIYHIIIIIQFWKKLPMPTSKIYTTKRIG